MIYLGQTCVVPLTRNSKPVPAVLLGKNSQRNYEFVYVVKGKIHELTQFTLNDVSPLRIPDKASPTGGKINYGEFCKNMEPSNYKIKVPNEDALINHLTKIQQELDNE